MAQLLQTGRTTTIVCSLSGATYVSHALTLGVNASGTVRGLVFAPLTNGLLDSWGLLCLLNGLFGARLLGVLGMGHQRLQRQLLERSLLYDYHVLSIALYDNDDYLRYAAAQGASPLDDTLLIQQGAIDQLVVSNHLD